MSSELVYQSKIITVSTHLGGHGFKMANRFLVGIPDLFIQLPNKPSLLLEVKLWSKLPVKKDTKISNGLTDIQKQVLIKLTKSGACVGWMSFYKGKTSTYVFADKNPNYDPTLSDYLENRSEIKMSNPWQSVLPSVLDRLYP